jgi:hypothetical protein
VGVGIAKVMASELQWRWRWNRTMHAGGRTCRTCSVRDPYYKRRVVKLGQEGAALKTTKVDLTLDEGPALL